MTLYQIVPLLIALLLAAAALYMLLLLRRRGVALAAAREAAEAQQAVLQQREQELIRLNDTLAWRAKEEERLRAGVEAGTLQLENARQAHQRLERDFAVLQTRYEEAQKQHTEQLRLLDEAKQALSAQFEGLAHRIFEQKAKTFDAANQQQLQLLLKPFREQIDAFSKQTQTQYVEESKERHLLKSEIERLKVLNERIAEDALNLTNALKGETKTQGNWGEIVLERVLESSGLRPGHEYETQGTYKDDKGNMLRPDVVVFLPQERCVIIDSKVSLVAYEQFMSSDDPEQKAKALRQHLVSINAHIKGLSEKRYENLPGMRTLDFVLLFMPIEGAFHLALQNDSGLFKKAYDARIIVVSPSTLLATLRTIENIWRTEQQQQNAAEIARQAEALYDKFVGFVEDMERIGDQLGRTQGQWEAAMNKLSSGKGNLIRRAEQMKKLGLSPKKALPGKDEGTE
ncbi:DNA recombination protein RmuC [Sulfurimonas sp. HSL-3221]|uniref:DNA recombination protein RmuC n=1 Tax=Sulfurimonadaceae TaxID=2771471 RepID=UPI001E50CE4E|nr:DNA recombination protein RmuC [Sulfurimonas sp. HSL-3221]UFS63793.1 DNA recombination protein RmuC [Sulfurimonas sp. HSL-3221]